MNDYQEIQINVGLNYTDESGNQGEFDRELARFLIEWRFNYCGIISEPYKSEWNCVKTGITYSDSCLAYKISVNRIQAFSIKAIRAKVDEICHLLRQDAVAFCVSTGDSTHSELHYADATADDKLGFDPRYFHFIA